MLRYWSREEMTVMKNLITRVLANYRIILVLASVAKVLLMAVAPTYGDLFNWAGGAYLVLGFLSVGRFPPVSATGVYGPIQLVLAPFFWFWTMLPVEHPSVDAIRSSSHSTASAISLIFLMRLPTFLADIAIGVLLLKLLGQVTGSDQKGKAALLLWYVNPFNVFWIEVFGGMDVIPTLLLLLAVVLGMNQKWFRSGFSIAVGAILRIFPLLTFPFFILAVKGVRARRAYALLLSGFLLPLMGALMVIYVTGAGTFVSILDAPLTQPWLLDFLGFELTNRYVRLVPVLLAVQFYVIIRCWKEPRVLHLVAVVLLGLLGAYVYGGINNHFLWVVPFLTASVAMNPDELWIFIVTFVTASLYPFILPIPLLLSATIHIFDPLFAGAFYAAKAAYLIKINFENIKQQFLRSGAALLAPGAST
jgi:hypothetical protein